MVRRRVTRSVDMEAAKDEKGGQPTQAELRAERAARREAGRSSVLELKSFVVNEAKEDEGENGEIVADIVELMTEEVLPQDEVIDRWSRKTRTLQCPNGEDVVKLCCVAVLGFVLGLVVCGIVYVSTSDTAPEPTTAVVPSSTSEGYQETPERIELGEFLCSNGVSSGDFCVSEERGLCVRLKKRRTRRPKFVMAVRLWAKARKVCAGFTIFVEV